MPKEHYIFIPHTRDHADTVDRGNVGGSLLSTASQWVRVSGKFTNDRIVCKGESFPDKIKQADEQTTVYVMGGHCVPGATTLTYKAGKKDYVDPTDVSVANDICAAGLPQSFPGKIKLYSCDSSATPTNSLSFSKRFADYMRAAPPNGKGFTVAQFFGYRGVITMKFLNPGVKEGADKFHIGEKARMKDLMEKHEVDLDKFHKYVAPSVGQNYVGRAKTTRDKV